MIERDTARRIADFSSALFLFMLVVISLAHGASGQAIDSKLWEADGQVDAIVLSGHTLYIAGSFSRVGPQNGAGAPVDGLSGEPTPGFPTVDGSVHAAVSDGGGGWYIGGAFSHVGGIARRNLAHILADGAVAAWDPRPNDDAFGAVPVLALAVGDGVVYVGGHFASIGGRARNRLAALDAVTGWATAWNPDVDGDVKVLAVSDGLVYAGGFFTHVGGRPRRNLAAVDAVTGQATAWNPAPNNQVLSLGVDRGHVYVGGWFTTIGERARNFLAALDVVTGGATDWDPSPNFSVNAFAVAGEVVYVGGDFTKVGGKSRYHIAAVSVSTGLVTPWDASYKVYGSLLALVVDGDRVLIAGGFNGAGGQARNHAAAIDTATGLATPWDPNTNGPVHTLALSGSRIYVGGAFTSIGGRIRTGLAALDVTTGAATAWNPIPNASIKALAVSGDTVYVGGAFSRMNGLRRMLLAAVDATNGLTLAWDPDLNGITVNALALEDDTLYIGGQFGRIGKEPRSHLGAVDVTTGLATSWDPRVTGQFVYALSVDRGTVYVGGPFNQIADAYRLGVAAIDRTTGVPTGWDPQVEGDASVGVFALAVSRGTAYVGGHFTRLGGQRRNHLGAVDLTTGQATAWNPNLDFSDVALAVGDGAVYAGGHFTRVAGQARNHLAALDAVTGEATPWNPGVTGTVRALAVGDGEVYLGGLFDGIGGQRRSNLAAVSQAPSTPPPVRVRFAIAPHRLHLESRRPWVTAFLLVPKPFRATDIDVSSLRLNDSVAVAEHLVSSRGVRMLVAKFSRPALVATLPSGARAAIAITGRVGGRPFHAIDSVSVGSYRLDIGTPSQHVAAGALLELDWVVPEDAPGSVDLLLTTDHGVTWSVQAASLPNRGTYWWTVPSVVSQAARLAIVKTTTDEDGVVDEAEYAESADFAIGLTAAGESVERQFTMRIQNPLVGSMRVAFELPTDAPAHVRVYDVEGRVVRSRSLQGKPGHLAIDFGRTPPGVYIIRLSQETRALTRRVAVIR